MSAPSPVPLDLNNVQGDILKGGLPKKTQVLFFFQINHARVHEFRTQLAKLVPLITSTAHVLGLRDNIAKNKDEAAAKKVSPPLLTISGVNLSFTSKGLKLMGINDEINDSAFDGGMLKDAQNLGDQGTTSSSGTFSPDWDPAFKKDIHDGISQPAVKDIDTNPNPGQETVRQGVILLGREGDVTAPPAPSNPITRPSWALDGSFLVFRYLFQLVPEFEAFLKHNPIPSVPDRAPSDLAPTADNHALAIDPLSNNNFSYNFPDDQTTQDRCPFAAHVRKTNPRGDLEDKFGPTELRRIIRAGIPFGPEVTAAEAASEKTHEGRGLLFVSYQSNIVQGFQFVQKSWANAQTFPPKQPEVPLPGFDPIIGQDANPTARTLVGTDPSSQATSLPLPQQWVVPKGGEYFFSPSISALKETFALPTSVKEL
ncbi:hypothetical protein P7C71_g2086, partial [Lecanoromycetidae sp. Uapishka_2]